MRSTLFEASLWLILAGGALQLRSRQRDLADITDQFMVEESRIRREIEAYKVGGAGAKVDVKNMWELGPKQKVGFKPPLGIY
jgi:hypothetical protein